MSKYNKYAKELQAAFMKMRTEFIAADEAVQKAKKAVEDLKYKRETLVGELANDRAIAAAVYEKAKISFDETKNASVAEYEKARKDISERFYEALSADSIAIPDDIDMTAMELLKSGIMKAADYENMAERFSNNITMLRMIGHHATAYRDKISDTDSFERRKINDVIKNSKSGLEHDKKTVWNNIVSAANTAAGIRPDGRVTTFKGGLLNWERIGLPEAIEAF